MGTKFGLRSHSISAEMDYLFLKCWVLFIFQIFAEIVFQGDIFGTQFTDYWSDIGKGMWLCFHFEIRES